MNLKKIFAGMFGSNDPKYRTAKPWEMIFAARKFFSAFSLLKFFKSGSIGICFC